MKQVDFLKPAMDWTDGTWAHRIDRCASMLFVHGYITMSQRDKIGKKLEAQVAAAIRALEVL